MTFQKRFPDSVRTWEKKIEHFLIHIRPELAADNSRGYIRFLEYLQAIPPEIADTLCKYLVGEGTIPGPETYVRARRDLKTAGRIVYTPQQQMSLDENEEASRHYFRGKKDARRNG